MKTKLCAAGVALLASLSLAMAPDPEQPFEFIPPVCDFGAIKEVDGLVSATVKAINISPDTTFITSIRTGCGCTGATYTDRIIAPGDTAEVSVTYNPENRPGRFLKTIKVFSGTDRSSSTFKIKGNVLPSEKSIAKSYPHRIGDLRLSSHVIDLEEVKAGEVRPVFVGLYNVGNAPMILSSDADCIAFEPKVMPDTILPNDPGTLSIVMKAKHLHQFGANFRHDIYLIDTQTKDTVATIPVVGILKKSE